MTDEVEGVEFGFLYGGRRKRSKKERKEERKKGEEKKEAVKERMFFKKMRDEAISVGTLVDNFL